MLLRIRREIFRAGEFETHEIANSSFREEVCREFHLDIENTEFYDDTGRLIKEDVFSDYVQITAVQKPAELATAAIIVAAVAVVASAAIIGYSLYWQKHGNQAKITYSNSLRGAQNPMRAGGPVGILLGNYRVPLDMAGLVYSSVENNKQFIHELFCAGYRPTASNAYCGVLLRTDASQVGGVPVYGGEGNPYNYKAWIGDTPFGSVAKSIKISASDDKADPDILDFPYYNRRCIEDSLALKLLNGDTSNGGSTENILLYQAPSGCYRIGVCMCAPYGYYELDKHGNQAESLMNYNIQVREVGTEAWTSVYRICRNMNVNEYRKLHYYTLTNLSGFSINKRYEVRIWMDDGRAWNGSDASHNTTMTVEFIQYDTANIAKYPNDIDYKAPVYNSQQYALVDMKAQATDKLTGYINQFYVECYLQCRAYHGDGTETSGYQSKWYVPSADMDVNTRIEMMSNPASVLLYVLTNKNVNPRALTWAEAADKIDWIAFRDWYLFCEEKHWTCNAWITDQMMIGKLCDLICSTGRAIFRTVNGKYSVLLACENTAVTQMFTPRNAWDMQMNKSFEKPLDAVRVEFVDESTWTEAERTARVDANNMVVIDEDITDIEDQLTVESFAIWGVTRPQQIADLEAYQLLQRRLQVRSYAWKCTLEGLMCGVGDVIYMANENFLYSLGYGRIKGLKVEDGYVVGVYVDESLGMESGRSYGITVRQNDGTFTMYPISSLSTDSDTFDKGILCTLASPVLASSAKVEEGNLFMYGDANVVGKKLLITNIQYDSDRNASIEAVDYIPEIFQSLDSPSWVVPDYVSGISKYGSGANFAKGAVPSVINNPPSSVHMTNVDIEGQIQGLRYDIEYGLSTSPVTPPSDTPAVFGYSDSDSYGADDPSDSEEFEYGFSDVYDWGTNFDKWYKGLYVWQRLKVTDTTGNITYTDPIYCKEITESLIAGCDFSIVLTDTDGDGDTHTWEKNLASSVTVPIQFRVMARAYGSTSLFSTALTHVEIIPFKNAVALTPITVPTPSLLPIDANTGRCVAVYNINLARNLDYDSLVINAVLSDTYTTEDDSTYTIVSKATETMTSVDATVYDPFGDLIPATKNAVSTLEAADALAVTYFTDTYGGLLVGDTYALNCDNITDVGWLSLRTYVGNNTWKPLSASDLGFSNARVSAICAKAQQRVLSQIPEGTVTLSDFGYFNTIIVGTITADYIGAKTITLQRGGVVQSNGVDETKVGSDGHLTVDGFRLEDTGTMRAKTGYFKKITVVDANVSGDFNSGGFATSKSTDSTTTIQFSSANLTGYYAAADFAGYIYYNMLYNVPTSGTYALTSAQINALRAAGVPSSWTAGYVGEVMYYWDVSGTYKNASFTRFCTQKSWSRSMTAYTHGYLINGVLYFLQIDDGTWPATSVTSDYTVLSLYSSFTYSGTTITSNDSGILVGYLLTSAALTSAMSSYSIPSGTEMTVDSGTITVSGTSLAPANTFLTFTATDLVIRDFVNNNTYSFAAENYYPVNAFVLSNVRVKTSMDGIKTKHIVPYSSNQYDIGTSANKYKDVHATKFHGALVNADGDGSVVYGAVFN